MALSGNFKNYPVKDFGLYCEWLAAQSAIGNYSDVTLYVYLHYYEIHVGSRPNSTISIDKTSETYTASAISHNAGAYVNKLLKSKTVRIYHNDSGKATEIPLSASWPGDITYSGVKIDKITASTKIDLNAIDRAAPTITISTSGVTESAVTVSASASTICDVWEYSTNGGSSWTQFSTTAGTSASKKITGLSPNASYTIKVRARKKSNQVYGMSSGSTITTLGNAILNSVTTVTADAETVSLTFNWTVYSTSFTYKLEIKNGSTVVTTITIPAQGSTGTSDKTITLTAEQRTALLNAIPSNPSFNGMFVLTTLSGSTTIGSTSSKTATVQTTKANSGPTFSNSAGFTYKDNNSTTSDATGDDQMLVQDYSTLTVTAYAATARNGASIKRYEATINDTTVSSTGTALNLGTVSKSGKHTLTVKAIDSRGYSVEVTKTITVIAYKKIDISDDVTTMRRVNEVEAITQVDFEAAISKILVSSINKNAFQTLKYRYKKTSESSYGSYVDISSAAAATDTYIIYESDEFVSLDPDYSYHIEFYVSDKITSDTFVITLPAGTPLISKRRKMVGINNRNPKAALDVVGGFILDGVSVDYIIQQGTSGIWTYRLWDSGIAECWGSKSVSVPVASAWGNVYTSGSLSALNISYPFTFKELPTLTASLSCSGVGAILMVPGGSSQPASVSSTGLFEICRGTAVANNATYTVNYHAIGKWK